jgi:hypothetical protein
VNPNIKTVTIREPDIIVGEIIGWLDRMRDWIQEVKSELPSNS